MAEILKPNMTRIWASGGAILTPSDSKIDIGWTAEIPPHQWENFAQNRQDRAIVYLFQHGIPEWDATTEYFADRAYVTYNGLSYRAIANSTGVLPTNTGSWVRWGFIGSEIVGQVPSATTTVQGKTAFATNAETIAGTVANKAVTPASLAANVASATNAGLTSYATNAETIAGTLATKAITPAGLAANVASTTNVGITRFATNAEANAGSLATVAVTPNGLSTAVPLLAPGRLKRVRVFSSNATYTPTAGTTSIIVEMVGGGGGGGGAGGATGSTISVGGGGGAGAYAKRLLTSGFSGIAITIGGGGSGVAAGNGQNGGTTSFGALVSASGGNGASKQGPAAQFFVAPGADGGLNTTSDVGGVGAAGRAGYAYPFTPAIGVGGDGADSWFGAGGRTGGNTAGSPGRGSGSGGGGTASDSGTSGANYAGGNGAAGAVIIWEFE